MKRNILTSVGVFLFAAGAQAGIVSFIPVVPGSDVVHMSELPVSVAYDVYLPGSQIENYLASFALVIGSFDVWFNPNDWMYSHDLGPFVQTINPSHHYPFGAYNSGIDMVVGADFGHTAPLRSDPLLHVGTVSVLYPPPGVIPTTGDKFFGVDPAVDGFSYVARHVGFTGALVIAPVDGQGVLHVVPEPNALILTAVGVVAILRRRRVGQCEESLR